MTTRVLQRILPKASRWYLLAAALMMVVAAVLCSSWVPKFSQLALSPIVCSLPANTQNEPLGKAEVVSHTMGETEHEHEAHDHTTPGSTQTAKAATTDGSEYDHEHNETTAIQLSQQARRNIGLRLAKVELRAFERSITVPATVVERPGWSTIEVTAPMTGIVSKIYPIQGEAVEPGQPLFEVRLTHEDLLQLQTEFLRTLEELDVTRREVARLEKVTAEGAIAGKTLLERKYEQQKQEALLRAQRQALLLHGLSQEHVDQIVASRTLLQSLTIFAPGQDSARTSAKHPLQVQQLRVSQGKYVNAGDTLCTLVDYGELYLEGRAFEQDIHAINRASAENWAITAVFGPRATDEEQTVQGLSILYLDEKVDRESRTFPFYIRLPNRLMREAKTPDGRRFAYWQFKPGQRAQVRIPVERWQDRIVLPVEAVVQEGIETYVFEANGDHFDRRPVHVEYRDQDWVVIANDGTLKIGAVVAVSAAQQLQLALKARSGGGIDPHAGHNH